MSLAVTLRPAGPADFEPLLDLSIRVMREHLDRVGRFDPARRRARMEAAFATNGMWVVERDGSRLGCVCAEPEDGALHLHALYLEPEQQGQGLGAVVFAAIRERHPGLRIRIEVLKGSPARHFWERQGFVLTGELPVDWLMERPAD